MIIAISAGHNTSKKKENKIRQHIRYLNYGLLGLSTLLRHQGNMEIMMFQADYQSPVGIFKTIEASGIDIMHQCECFLLSVPSYYSISWAEEFSHMARVVYQKDVVVGGRWVVDSCKDWISLHIPSATTYIDGFGERKLAQYFEIPNWNTVPDGSTQCFDYLDYTILYEYQQYQPCIEISRGCGAGCSFCADKGFRRLPNKPVSIVLHELENLDRVYGDYSVYFEAPHFVFEREWINQLCRLMMVRQTPHAWRCTSRVESVPLDLLSQMHNAGLAILDIGLESASKRQLIRMGKTNNPERYLEKADKLLKACDENGIWVKFNLLLYAGETYETVSETIDWLSARKSLIKDVSVSSLIYYRDAETADEYLRFGASIPPDIHVDDYGYVDMNLSPEIDNHTAQSISLQIPKLFANQKDFYDVKSISYFERGYTYSQFLEDLRFCNAEDLPFTIETT